MAENFRKSKIQKYYDSLKVHSDAVKERQEGDSSANEVIHAHREGFLMAMDMVMKGLEHEFDLESDVKETRSVVTKGGLKCKL